MSYVVLARLNYQEKIFVIIPNIQKQHRLAFELAIVRIWETDGGFFRLPVQSEVGQTPPDHLESTNNRCVSSKVISLWISVV